MGNSASSALGAASVSPQPTTMPTTLITTTRSAASISSNGKVQSLSSKITDLNQFLSISALTSSITNSHQLVSTAAASSSRTSLRTTSTLSTITHITDACASTSLPPVNQQTGAHTVNTACYPAATAETGIYSIITQDGGLCRLTVTDTSTPTLGTYIAATTLVAVDRRGSSVPLTTIMAPIDHRTVSAFIPLDVRAPTANIPFGTTEVPATDIPLCPSATASGTFQPVSTGHSQSSATSIDSSNQGLSPGQKAGIAVGVVVAVVLLIIGAGYYMWKKGQWRQGTQAQSNIWGPGDAVGGTNAGGMTEGERIASGQGLRDVLYSNRMSGHR